MEREHEFRFLAVEYEPLDGKPSTNVAVSFLLVLASSSWVLVYKNNASKG